MTRLRRRRWRATLSYLGRCALLGVAVAIVVATAFLGLVALIDRRIDQNWLELQIWAPRAPDRMDAPWFTPQGVVSPAAPETREI